MKAGARILLIAVALTMTSAQGSDMNLSGADFLSACSRPDSGWIGFCHGYVQAVYDDIDETDGLCVPPGTTRARIVGDVVEHLINTPDARELDAASVIRNVLTKAYPCR